MKHFSCISMSYLSVVALRVFQIFRPFDLAYQLAEILPSNPDGVKMGMLVMVAYLLDLFRVSGRWNSH
jgi:hypothetical protein